MTNDGNDNKQMLLGLPTTASNSPIIPDHSRAGQTDTEVSVETNLHNYQKRPDKRSVSICNPVLVKKDQPNPQLPSSTEAFNEVSQLSTSISRRQENLTAKVKPQTDGDDLCAAILLACLFCHPLDCLLATVRGCNECVWSLCSSLCGCEPTSRLTLLDIAHHCDLCGCLGVRCCRCDCSVCDVCLQATECLDLAMEISQMLYH